MVDAAFPRGRGVTELAVNIAPFNARAGRRPTAMNAALRDAAAAQRRLAGNAQQDAAAS
jgi:hypothetical protein